MDEMAQDHHLLGFDECAFVLSHPESFSVEHAGYPGAEDIRGRRGVQLIDGEPHRKLHAFLTGYFSSYVEHLRVSILRPMIADAIKCCAECTELEIFEELAAPLSLRIIATILG